jgi:sulfur-carrier protein
MTESNVRVELPYHLRTLAKVGGTVELRVVGPVTQTSVVDALELKYPMLSGTVRDHSTGVRRPFLRFFACGEDLSHNPADAPLPDAVASGDEALLIIASVAGG